MTYRGARHGHPAAPAGVEYTDGILLVDKPSGPTSHDVVHRIRRRFGFRKVGHGGTLDPQATGLLVILVGRTTKLSSRFLTSDKSYEGAMCLGVATDSQDAQGQVVATRDFAGVTRAQVEAGMARRTGDILQIPPMVSAKKVEGVPLYKRARRGQVLEREAKPVHVYEFTLTAFAPPRVAFRLRCSKGTYVRTLCADIGEELGCGAHLAELRRTRSGDYTLADALPLDALLEMNLDGLLTHMIPLREVAAALRPGPR
ncbi:MAG: tRNA pseudouridine(55) synthase TruB [Lentisphaerae bacterium]|nr:tRNA pseudouridine(55) synthase TruB [Lentisphaerota bacterium]